MQTNTASLGNLFSSGNSCAAAPSHAENYVRRPGNLTLLEPTLNRDTAARPFLEKLPLYVRSAYALTQSPEWTPDTLSAGQHSLVRRALPIWRSDFVATP